MVLKDLVQLSEKTDRVERHWIGGKKCDLPVYRIPIDSLYFNIENGRYADRMIRLKSENPGQEIDPRKDKWKREIEKMLAGDHKDTSRDKSAFNRLVDDLRSREQLRPGVVLADGGVIDGNRRLAALLKLRHGSRNTAQYSAFDGVILPERETTTEDRWRIEAGIQLSIADRWDYSPINELLKVRAGLVLYDQMIAEGQHRGEKATALVAKAIYGKDEVDVKEMAARLQLIDEYLDFLEKSGQYDIIGSQSEDFVEAQKIVTAARNHQREPRFIAKIKAILFYQIHQEQMDNWELRNIYHALGGDPTKRGPKRTPNEKALKDFMDTFPEPREIQRELTGKDELGARPPSEAPKSAKKPAEVKGGAEGGKRRQSEPPKPRVDRAKVGASTERFIRTMQTSGKEKPLRKIAEGARADVQALQLGLADKKRREEMELEDAAAVKDAVTVMLHALKDCERQLKKS